MTTRLPQEELISAVRTRSKSDERVLAVLMYGSFAKGEGDRFSDVEFYVFVADDELSSLDRHAWVSSIAPVSAFFVNEFGTDVAIFENLVRGEFHFEPHGSVGRVRGWTSIESLGSAKEMLVLDQRGELTSALGDRHRTSPSRDLVQELYDRFLNWYLLGCNVLRRGERARALDALGRAHVFLLQLARIREGALEHWLTPSRNLEHELSRPGYEAYCSCTASLAADSLTAGYGNAWQWSRELMADLSPSWNVDSRHALVESIEASLPSWLSG